MATTENSTTAPPSYTSVTLMLTQSEYARLLAEYERQKAVSDAYWAGRGFPPFRWTPSLVAETLLLAALKERESWGQEGGAQ